MAKQKLQIVDVSLYHPIKKELGELSHEIEYRLKPVKEDKKPISEEEVYVRLRRIINLVDRL